MANTTKQRTMLERNMRAQKTRQRIVGTAAQVFYYLFLLVMAVIVLFPFYWMWMPFKRPTWAGCF